MIYDIITFNGEYDLLEIRLNILNDFVDQFIIVEGDTTFSGNPKPLYFEQGKQRYEKWLPKIKYYVVNDYPNDEKLNEEAWASPTVPFRQTHWHREYYQKESIKKAMTDLKDDDICFVGDCDEIWNPEILKLPFDLKSVYKLKQYVYAYYLNNRTDEVWAGTYLTSYKTIKNGSLNLLRTRHPCIYIEKAGWHFTNMGGLGEIKRKLESYGHQEFNTPEIKDNLEKMFLARKDFIGRDFKMWTEEALLPKYLLDNKNKYGHLFNNS